MLLGGVFYNDIQIFRYLFYYVDYMRAYININIVLRVSYYGVP